MRAGALRVHGPTSSGQLLDDRHTTVVAFDPTYRWTCEHTAATRCPAMLAAAPDRLARRFTGHHPGYVFPGCAMPAQRCKREHVIPWLDGPRSRSAATTNTR